MAKLEDAILRDTLVNRPAAGSPGRLFYDTTNSQLQRDNGSSWDSIEAAATGSGVVTSAAAASADLTLTTSLQDIAGASLSFTPASTEIVVVHAVFDFDVSSAANNTMVGNLDLDGVTQTPGEAHFNANVAGARATVYQMWRLTGVSAAAHTLKLRALKAGATGTLICRQTHTKIVIARYA